MEKITLTIEVSPESAFVLQSVAKDIQASLGDVVEGFMVLGKAFQMKTTEDRVRQSC